MKKKRTRENNIARGPSIRRTKTGRNRSYARKAMKPRGLAGGQPNENDRDHKKTHKAKAGGGAKATEPKLKGCLNAAFKHQRG